MRYKEFIAKANANETRVAVAADLMSLVLLTPPGEWGADVVFGSSQRFGIPMFYGGPSAAYLQQRRIQTCYSGTYHRYLEDAYGHPAYRLALQTREQHIKREKATSNNLYRSGTARNHGRILYRLSRTGRYP